MNFRRKIWYCIGVGSYYLLLPLIKLYATHSKPRTRVLIVHDNHALVVKNWLGSKRWALPGGGLETGEQPIKAAIRELKEELDLNFEANQLKPFGLHTSVSKEGLKSAYHLYVIELAERPRMTLRPYEIMDATWLSFDTVLTDKNGVSQTVHDSAMVWLKAQNLVS